ncbi:hypothetical protein HanPSC8_Chr01g0031301 [Helianthus annuus]|nr:hypothetical protein HanPSC8_Chr01g0031301 [Helianthus annuus]
MCIGIQRPRGLNHRLSILCKVVNVTFRHKPTLFEYLWILMMCVELECNVGMGSLAS